MRSEAVDRVLAKLPDARRNGKGWIAKCPAHDDRRPSLSVAEGDDGRALVRCHAGCSTEEVVARLGLSMADLMPGDRSGADRTHVPRPARAVSSTSAASKPAKTYGDAADAVAELERRLGKASQKWTYHDADGREVGLVLRFDTPDGKEIRPVSRNGMGWALRAMQSPRPLYRLSELVGADRVYVTEGEKAAAAARSIGLTATTSAHGSKSAGKTDWLPLAGKEVVVLPDNDEAGARYADEVAGILSKLSPAPSVRVVHLPGLPAGGDIADLLQARGGDADAVRAEVVALADSAAAIEPDRPAPPVEPFRPFPVDVLPEPFRRFVVAGAKALGCDSSYIALPLLTAAASAVGNTRRIQLKRSWTEPVIIWTVIVGESGTLKSPALELALRAVRKRQQDAMREYEAAMERYRVELMRFERDLARWKRSKSDDDPPEKLVPPVADRCWTDDATVEALAVLLLNQWRGILVARDELAGWVGGFDRYAAGKGSDAAKWLEMFGGRPMVVDRKTSGTISIPKAAVSITGGIQPETLRRALGIEYRENGLAARLLLTCPPRWPKRWTDADIDPRTEEAVAAVFDRLYALKPDHDDDGDAHPVPVPLTAGSKKVWVDFYNDHAREQAELTGDLSAAWSKLEGYAARLALVVHFVRWAADDSTLLAPDAVDEVSMRAGIALARWFGHEARRVYAMLAESEEDRDRRRLVDLIRIKGGSVTPRDLIRSARLFKDTDEAKGALVSRLVNGF